MQSTRQPPEEGPTAGPADEPAAGSTSAPPDIPAQPELVAIEVRDYKNLRDLEVPWCTGMALFGVNGSGKTNVLECLALLMGTDRTIHLASPRIATPEPGALALLARPGRATLPWPAGLVLPWVGPRGTASPGGGSAESSSVAVVDRAWRDAAWWRGLGATHGRTFGDALASAGLPVELCSYVVDLAREPVVRYRLVEFGRSAAAHDPGCPRVVRRFERTLLADAVPDRIIELARATGGRLPAALAPLYESALTAAAEADEAAEQPDARSGGRSDGRSVDGAEDGAGEHPVGTRWFPVLSLPDVGDPPASLQWLARSRSTAEIETDIREALAQARLGVDSLASAMDAVARRAPSRAWRTWVHQSGARRAHDELQITLPGVSVLARAGDDGFSFAVDPGDGPVVLGGEDGVDALEYLSSGERRWVDEALATASQELLDLARLASLHSGLLEGMTPNRAAGVLEQTVGTGGWHGEDGVDPVEGLSAGSFAGLLHGLQPALVSSVLAEGMTEPVSEPDGEDAPIVLVGTRTPVRVFDEPEAHLHPAAQRLVAGAIHRLRADGANLVIASHSPHFLDLPGWSTVHVRPGDHGAVVETLPQDWGGAQSLLAKEMGINRGELMAGINAVLVVEGTHDQRMLSRLYGDRLREAGVAVLRMHGTSNLIATVDLDLVNRYLDVPMIMLLDYTHVDRVLAGHWETSEERKLAELQRSSRRRQRAFTLLGLHRPDVVCYLNEEALAERYPSFPGWQQVLERFEGVDPRPPFKSWLKAEFAVDITRWRRINQIVTIMLRRGLPAVEEMTAIVDQVVALVPTPFVLPRRPPRDSSATAPR